jgi:hypothetical protein
MPKFKIDENLPIEAAELLAGAGHHAVTVGDQRLMGEPDTNVATVCQREGRACARVMPPAQTSNNERHEREAPVVARSPRRVTFGEIATGV